MTLSGCMLVVINNTQLHTPLGEDSIVNHVVGGLDFKLSGLFMEVFASI